MSLIGTKQVYVPEANTKDPAAISHADILYKMMIGTPPPPGIPIMPPYS